MKALIASLICAGVLTAPASFAREIWGFVPPSVTDQVRSGELSRWSLRMAQDMNLILAQSDSSKMLEGFERFHEGVFCAEQTLGENRFADEGRVVASSVLFSQERLAQWIYLTDKHSKNLKDPSSCPLEPALQFADRLP